MKILHLFDFFSPAGGGGTVSLLYKVTQALAQRGHEVSIYTSDFELDRNYIDSLPGVRIKLFHCISGAGQFYLTPSLNREIKNHLKEFDVVHSHCFRSYQNIIIHRYARKYHIPYVLDTHGSLPRAAAGKKNIKWLMRGAFDIAFGYRILKDASKVIAETQLGIHEYKAFNVPDNKIVMITPPFAIEEFAQLPPAGFFRQKYHLNGKRIVMFLGRIHQIKGLDFLVQSFQELTRVRDDVVLVIVGNDDGYKATLDNLIAQLKLSDKVIFTGFLGGRDKLSALVDADVVVQTSIYEQGAWAPYEAVLCNTPIIVSNNSGAGEDVKKIDAGYLVEYGNKIDFKDTMQYVLNNMPEAKAKTRKAKAYIETNLSIARCIERYEQLYKEVAGR